MSYVRVRVAVAIGWCAIAACTDLGGLSGASNETDGGGTDGGPTPVPPAPGDDGSTPPADGGADASRYSAVVLEDKPLAYLRLGEPVTPTAKDETGAHDGIYKGGITLGVPGAIAGDPDTAAQFDGTDGVVEIASAPELELEGAKTFTAEAWVKRTSTCGGIFGKTTYTADAGYEGWFFGYNSSQTQIEFLKKPVGVATTRPADNGQFVHTVAAFDGATLFFYLDGATVDTTPSTPQDAVNGAKVVLGYVPNWGRFAGVLDEVAIYDHALTPARVKLHHDVGLGK
jgi:hypothetical protein